MGLLSTGLSQCKTVKRRCLAAQSLSGGESETSILQQHTDSRLGVSSALSAIFTLTLPLSNTSSAVLLTFDMLAELDFEKLNRGRRATTLGRTEDRQPPFSRGAC